MELRDKLEILSASARYDASCACSGSRRRTEKGGIGNASASGICHSFTPDGRCVSLLKILLTNYCIHDCLYCANRRSSNVRRASFTPEEVAKLTIDFYRRNYIEGLFLSSGVFRNLDYTMEQMIRACKILRTDYGFGGYIHLKAIPGASRELLYQAGLVADRLSANIELPTEGDLKALAPGKNFYSIQGSMSSINTKILEYREAKKKRQRPPLFTPGGQSTQMVIGATPSTDLVILNKASSLYQVHDLRRVYYSAYVPVPDAGLVLPKERAPLIREHRLYQADWLLRYYGFEVSEIASREFPNLDLGLDPKLSWALRHREFFPVDINRASREALLRVPGLGCRSVDRILYTRRFRRLTLERLKQLKVSLKRTKYFVLAADANPALRSLERDDFSLLFRSDPLQLSLFGNFESAVTGEL